MPSTELFQETMHIAITETGHGDDLYNVLLKDWLGVLIIYHQ
jgi:hypothetical protein